MDFEDRIDIEALFADIGALISNEQSQVLLTEASS
jgi:hypothetical protein